MYSIRVEPETNQLLVTLTGRVSTAEALRAASQAFTLAEAGRIAAIACDTTALRRGVTWSRGIRSMRSPRPRRRSAPASS